MYDNIYDITQQSTVLGSPAAALLDFARCQKMILTEN